MPRIIRKVIGGSILTTLVAVLIIAMVKSIGFLATLAVFRISILVTALVILALYLLHS